MKTPFNRIKKGRLAIICYCTFIILSIIACLFNASYNYILRATGKLETIELSLQDFDELDQIEITGENSFVTLDGGDAKMIKYFENGIYAHEISVNFKFSRQAGEMNAYYVNGLMKRLGQGFSANKRVWAFQDSSGAWHYEMPKAKLYALRIDPGSFSHSNVEFEKIVLNPKHSFFSYFVPSYKWLFKLIIYPAVVSAALGYLYELYIYYVKKQRKCV